LLGLALGIAAAACSTTTQTSTVDTAIEGIPLECFVRGAAPDAGADAEVVPGSAEPIRCANDAECGAGARCDTKLGIPRCVELYCVPDTAPCSSDLQCQRGRKCHDGACNPCNTCGNLCEVDFTTDPKNCGGCNQAVGPEQTCVDGKPTCPKATPDLCGDKCVDLAHDPNNCGACGKTVPTGATCNKGKSPCPNGGTVCGGACVDTQGDNTTQGDANNCGACGKVCRSDTECHFGACEKAVLDYKVNTCTAACANDGLTCLAGGAVYNPIGDTSGKNDTVANLGCTTAAAPPSGYALHYMSCMCRYVN
jgi:hypothetical protein